MYFSFLMRDWSDEHSFRYTPKILVGRFRYWCYSSSQNGLWRFYIGVGCSYGEKDVDGTRGKNGTQQNCAQVITWKLYIEPSFLSNQ